MKQIIYLGEVYLVIYNNSNNWLLTKSKKVAMEHNEEDLQKCSSFCFQPSTITLHITNMCNMQCKYCFTSAGINNVTVMDMQIIEKVTDLINELSMPRVCFDFHGGEPLTQKKLIIDIVNFFEENIIGKKIDFYIQTNATLIDDDMAIFLKQHKFIVGVSLDGRVETNDLYRVMSNGEGSLKRILQGIECLKRWEIPFACLAVVTNPEEMIKNYEFFIANEIYNIQFMPVMPQGRADKGGIFIKDWVLYADKELELFERILDDRKNGKPVIHSSSYTILRKIVLKEDKNMCMRRPCGAGINVISIDEGGNIFPCDSMSGINNQMEICIGNIMKYDHLKELISEEQYNKLNFNLQKYSEKCDECFCKSICCGGCKSDIYNAYGEFGRETPMCEYYRHVIKGYFNVLYKRKKEVIDYLKG